MLCVLRDDIRALCDTNRRGTARVEGDTRILTHSPERIRSSLLPVTVTVNAVKVIQQNVKYKVQSRLVGG